ncbi:hypothetical protein E2C01_049860 [Portunus trituberculatus]|uniref:Uncharacterized protein n=1 Tax=Portunus trituberculatus TaxID=210409 RepID=A0A5B7GEX9_PORTR|nr:hypothetical protein [Portunus trituberculatus]
MKNNNNENVDPYPLSEVMPKSKSGSRGGGQTAEKAGVRQEDNSSSRWRYGEKQQEPRLAAFPVRRGTSLKRGKVFTKGRCAGV